MFHIPEGTPKVEDQSLVLPEIGWKEWREALRSAVYAGDRSSSLDDPSPSERIRRSMQVLFDALKETEWHLRFWMLQKCDSPVEHLFLMKALERVTFVDGKPMLGRWRLHQQVVWEEYTLDFMLISDPSRLSSRSPRLVIELDGFAYHERTPEQATHDRSRDRKLAFRGFRVIRFTAHEVKKDAKQCVDEVLAIAEALDPEPFEGLLGDQ